MSRRKKVHILERRLAYLQERIELCIGSPAALNWMQAEAAALEWALDELKELIDLREEDRGCEDSVSGRRWRDMLV